MLQFLLTNAGGKYREEELEGRTHVVCDTVMLTEGVHEGSYGPVLYENEVIGNDVSRWDHMPVIIRHPKKRDGSPGKSREVRVLNEQKVGILLNTKIDNTKLKTQCWLDKDRLMKLAPTVYEKIKRGEKVEVSTGINVVVENKEGEWAGEKYIARVKILQPDHLAILPDSRGACSIADGAGLLANEQLNPYIENDASFSDIRMQISQKLRDVFQEPGYIWMGHLEDVFATYFIYCDDSSLYQQNYSTKDGIVTFDGEPTEVVRITEYRAVSNDMFVGNASGVFISNAEKKTMDKKQKVDTLIANSTGVWEESDRNFLMTQDDAKLDKHLKTIQNQQKAPEPVPAPTPAPAPTPVPANKPQTFKELLNSDPSALEQWNEGQQALTAEKNRLIQTITNGGKDTVYTVEELNAEPIARLRKMAQRVGGAAPAQTSGSTDYSAFNAIGVHNQNGSVPVDNEGKPFAPLGFPSMDFTEAKK